MINKDKLNFFSLFLIAVIIILIFRFDIISICILLSSISCAYLSAVGHRYTYYINVLYYIFVGYVNYLNGLYFSTIFSIFVFLPFQFYGIVKWKINSTNNVISSKTMKIKSKCCVLFIGITISIVGGFLFNLIPSQNLSYLDSFTNIMNIFAVALCALRYSEAWTFWLINNTLDLTIWSINFINKTQNSLVMLIISIIYFSFNIYAIIKWKNLKTII